MWPSTPTMSRTRASFSFYSTHGQWNPLHSPTYPSRQHLLRMCPSEYPYLPIHSYTAGLFHSRGRCRRASSIRATVLLSHESRNDPKSLTSPKRAKARWLKSSLVRVYVWAFVRSFQFKKTRHSISPAGKYRDTRPTRNAILHPRHRGDHHD